MDVVDAVRCPKCGSVENVKTAATTVRAIYFCFSCGRAFEVKLPPQGARG